MTICAMYYFWKEAQKLGLQLFVSQYHKNFLRSVDFPFLFETYLTDYLIYCIVFLQSLMISEHSYNLKRKQLGVYIVFSILYETDLTTLPCLGTQSFVIFYL